MVININNIDETRDAKGTETISVSYERDGRLLVATCKKTPDVVEAVIQFISGHISDSELMASLIGIGDAASCREVLEPLMKRISCDLAFDGNHVFWCRDGKASAPIDETLETHLVRLIKAGANDEDVQRWAALTVRLQGMPLRNRAAVLNWLDCQGGLNIDDEGRLIGNYACAFDDDAGHPTSSAPTLALVDGERIDGYVPMRRGSVIEVPRKATYRDANTNPDITLYLATPLFAKSWTPVGGAVATVAVAPEDIAGSPNRQATSRIECRKFEVIDWYRPDDDMCLATVDWKCDEPEDAPWEDGPFAGTEGC